MSGDQHTNRLIKEKSPYLLQHAHNPVDWYPWGEEAFAKARKENKPILLSIGYSTCHWCHVMEHESFEDESVARMMNEYFVSIKVDREERSEIDQIYMSAVTALTGQGGWPLTVFLAPDRKPFWGGTYFPPEARFGMPGFKDVLRSVNEAWHEKKEEILHSSQRLTQMLQGATQQAASGMSLDTKILEGAYQQFLNSFDDQYGGFGTQPKFPSGHNLSFLLRYWKRTQEPQALEMVEETLTAMHRGGICDHLGGGFHRYATDQRWQIPHFEKMLYDQAIVARAYLEAFQATGKALYAQAAREIFEYVLRDMRDAQGGFFSAEDADSFDPQEFSKKESGRPLSKKEGAFYLWRSHETIEILGPEDGRIFNYQFGVEEEGNAHSDPHGEFAGKNILYLQKTSPQVASHFQKSPEEIDQIIRRSKEKLFKIREGRPRPHLDDKILVDWNGLMISSLAFGSRVLEEPRYARAAAEAAEFILKYLRKPDGRLLHRFREKEAAILGTLSDYAFLIHGLLDLYEATFNEEFLKEALQLANPMIDLFGDDPRGGFFFTASDAEELFLRQKEIYDGAIPSSNSVAALDLIRLARITLDQKWEEKAENLFGAFSLEISQRPGAYGQMLIALDFFLGPSREIILAGSRGDPQLARMVKSIYSKFLPNKVVILRSPDEEINALVLLIPSLEPQKPIGGKLTVYVCENHVCQLPVFELEKLDKMLQSDRD